MSIYKRSPDGSQLAFTADVEIDNLFDLYAVQSDGRGQIKVSGTQLTGVGMQSLSW